jgi:hypothetical protein
MQISEIFHGKKVVGYRFHVTGYQAILNFSLKPVTWNYSYRNLASGKGN